MLDMSVMYRIICRKLLVLIRLAIIVSLAGYSLSNPAMAMHVGPLDNHQTSLSQTMDQVDASIMSDESARYFTTDSEDSTLALQECNDDFCAGFVLVTFQDDSGGPVVSVVREFIDENGVYRELHGLHRPPSI